MSKGISGTSDVGKTIAEFTILVSIVVTGWVVASYFEARAFNSVTGKNVSTADAMFLRLRVQEPAEEPD